MKYLVIIVLFLIAAPSWSQDKPKEFYRIDSVGNTKKVRLVGLPVVFYTPETQVGFGGGGQLFFLRQTDEYRDRLSNVLFTAIYTTNKQIIIDLKPQIYFERGNYFLDVAYKFKIFPNSFWGIGNNSREEDMESYNMTSNEVRVSFLKRLPPSLNFGFEFIYDNHDVTETEEGGILESEDILGNDGAIITGLGAIINLDSRDNVASPTSGHFFQLNARFSSRNFGATEGFNKFITDLRTYIPLAKRSILALQLYNENNFGDVPFQAKAWFGGGERGRGYFRGRFIDNHQIVAQAEYRLRFHPRWIAAGFVLAGEVAEDPDDYIDNLKTAMGGGIRFKFVKDQDIFLRLDIGIGEDGNSGFYFGINEAF